jgi:hypothetical protein
MTDAMTDVVSLPVSSWTEQLSEKVALRAVAAIERGDVLCMPLSFPVEADEHALFSPAILSSAKNASYDPASGKVGGTTLVGDDLERLRRFLGRFSDAAAGVADRMLPRYRERLERARASFRPAEIAGRPTSWRKDDTRLHVDSFPASPVQGRRILRLFANVNPQGRARSWRVGEDFEALAARFAPSLSPPVPGTSALLHLLRVTRSRRTDYDALMLQLHDRMKEDVAYQANAPQRAVEFPAGTAWMAFTDQVSHAAMSGQYQLEQTFLLPLEAMVDENGAPLRVLERLKGRRLT